LNIGFICALAENVVQSGDLVGGGGRIEKKDPNGEDMQTSVRHFLLGQLVLHSTANSTTNVVCQACSGTKAELKIRITLINQPISHTALLQCCHWE
jgi:hypothetical protein